MNNKGFALLPVVLALAGIVAGVFGAGLLLGRPQVSVLPSAPVGGISGNTATIPFVFADTVDFVGNFTAATADFSGELEVSLIEEGSLLTLTPATTTVAITAAQLCNNNVISHASNGLTTSSTLPASSGVTDDCLSTNGDSVEFVFRNTTTTSETTIVAGDASTTLFGVGINSSTVDTVPSGNSVIVKVVRVGVDTLIVFLTQANDAD